MASRPRVYIGRLPSRARESDVERFFRGYGKVRDVMLKNGFGFVELDDYRDADDAIRDLDGRELCGERVSLEIAKGIPRGAGGAFVSGYVPPPASSRYYSDKGRSRDSGRSGGGGASSRPGFGRPSNGYKVIIENLSTHCNWQDLKDMCEEYGEILYADAHHYRRNEAVVEFAKKGDMEYAVQKLDGKAVNGKRMKMIPENNRHSRSLSPLAKSRSRSRERHSSRRSRGRDDQSRSRSPIGRKRSRSDDDGHHNGRDRNRSGSVDRYESRRSRSSRGSRSRSRSD